MDMSNQQVMEAQQQKMQAYRDFQIKLKHQKQRERELLETRLRQEEEMMLKERDYQSMQEELDDMRKLIKKLRIRYKQTTSELKDLGQEHNREKQELFSQIKDQDRETLLYRMILQTFVPKVSLTDINTIVSNSEYDNDQLTWKVVIPPSIQKKHKLKLIPKKPTLS